MSAACPFCDAPEGSGKDHGCPNLWSSCWRCGRRFDVVEMLALIAVLKKNDRRHHVPDHVCDTGPNHGKGCIRSISAYDARLNTVMAHVRYV